MRKGLLVIICFLVQFVSVAAQETYVNVARQAEELSRQGQYEESYEAYTKAIGIKATDYKLWVNRGICLMNLKRFDEAMKDFNQALQRKPDELNALRGRASSKAQLKDFKGAIVDYTNVLSQQPRDNQSFFERAKAKQQAGDAQGALADFKECLNRAFQQAESNYWIGVVYFDQKDFKRSAEAFHAATLLDKTLTDASYREALSNAELGYYEKAVQILTPVLEKNAGDAGMYTLRATLNIKAKNYREAMADIEKLGRLKPGNTDAIMLKIKVKNGLSDYRGALTEIDSLLQKYPTGNELLFLEQGKALYHTGKRLEAEEAFDHSLSISPDFVDTYLERGQLYLDKQNYRKAVEDFSKAIEVNDKLAISWYLKGKALIGLEQGDEAMVAINQGLGLGSGLPEMGYHFRGLAQETNGNQASAMSDYEKALSINPAYAPARVDRATLLFRQGKTQEAYAEYKKAQENDSTNVSALCGQGRVLLTQKKPDQALSIFSRAIGLDVTCFEAFYGRGLANNGLGKKKEAKDDFNRAIQLNDRYAEAYFERGMLNKQQGDKKAAWEDFDKAVVLGYGPAKKEMDALGK